MSMRPFLSLPAQGSVVQMAPVHNTLLLASSPKFRAYHNPVGIHCQRPPPRASYTFSRIRLHIHGQRTFQNHQRHSRSSFGWMIHCSFRAPRKTHRRGCAYAAVFPSFRKPSTVTPCDVGCATVRAFADAIGAFRFWGSVASFYRLVGSKNAPIAQVATIDGLAPLLMPQSERCVRMHTALTTRASVDPSQPHENDRIGKSHHLYCVSLRRSDFVSGYKHHSSTTTIIGPSRPKFRTKM